MEIDNNAYASGIFFHRTRISYIFSIGLGVHPGKNNWRAKQTKLLPFLAEFTQSLPEICPNSYIGKMLEDTIPPPPSAPRLLRLWLLRYE